MAKIVWTLPALEDLDEIADYISLDNPTAAKKLVASVFKKVDKLVKFPNLGSKPKELHKTNYRHLVISACRVFYRADKNTIYIVHIMRTDRSFRLANLKRKDFE